MVLTEQEKKQLEEEEQYRKKLREEEAYRNKIREQSATKPVKNKTSWPLVIFLIIFCFFVVVLVLVSNSINSNTLPTGATITITPISR